MHKITCMCIKYLEYANNAYTYAFVYFSSIACNIVHTLAVHNMQDSQCHCPTDNIYRQEAT